MKEKEGEEIKISYDRGIDSADGITQVWYSQRIGAATFKIYERAEITEGEAYHIDLSVNNKLGYLPKNATDQTRKDFTQQVAEESAKKAFDLYTRKLITQFKRNK